MLSGILFKVRCHWTRRRLGLFVGGDLDATDSARVSRHLSTCKRCQDELGRLRAANDVLRKLAGSDATLELPSVLPGVLSRIRTGDFHGSVPSAQRLKLSYVLGVVVAVIALIAVVPALLLLQRQSGNDTGHDRFVQSEQAESKDTIPSVEQKPRPAFASAGLEVVALESAELPESNLPDETLECRYSLELATPVSAYSAPFDEF